MMTAEYVLELTNVFHSGQVRRGDMTCAQHLHITLVTPDISCGRWSPAPVSRS